MKNFINILGMLLLFTLSVLLGYFCYLIKNYDYMGWNVLIGLLMFFWGAKICNDHEQ